MKILAFTDTHGNKKAIDEIIRKTKEENPDLLICCGDLSIFGEKLDVIAKKLNELNKKILIIPGNHETEEQIRYISLKYKNILNLHKGLFEYNNHLFFGYGEGGFSTNDEKFERITAKLEKDLSKDKPLILILHAPPHKTNLDILQTGHVGNKSYRKFIEKVSPIIVLSGHIHENEKKQDKINTTLLINPGREGCIIEI
jgi:putative phosphoesterase